MMKSRILQVILKLCVGCEVNFLDGSCGLDATQNDFLIIIFIFYYDFDSLEVNILGTPKSKNH